MKTGLKVQGRGTSKLLVFFLVIMVMLMWVVPAFAAKEINLTYRLKWLFNTSVAGDLMAEEAGFFANEGLSVNIKEGGPERNAIKELELGYTDFGVASADQVIRAVSKGADIVVIAQLFQINPLQWIYRADQPEIKTLSDLKGRNVGITYGGNDETIMKTLIAKSGLGKGDLKLSSVRYDYTPFFKRKVEVWPVYRNAQGIILKEKLSRSGEDVYFFNPSDFGVNFVANSVVTSKKMMEERPQVVEKFLKALLMGWEKAMDPERGAETLKMLSSYDRDTQDAIRSLQLDATRKLIKPYAETRIGIIDVDAWKQTEKIMLEQGQIKKTVNIEKHLVPLR